MIPQVAKDPAESGHQNSLDLASIVLAPLFAIFFAFFPPCSSAKDIVAKPKSVNKETASNEPVDSLDIPFMIVFLLRDSIEFMTNLILAGHD
ncbi:MAG: hypothetical protein U5O39_07230 [Gammaproteobacteria bacterium]|nr:hypothetical protein [Gammaproteobacteria bacterium]